MKTPSSSSLLGLVSIVSLAAGLGACAPNTVWIKPGASADELRAAQRECSRTASDYSFVDTSFYDGVERNRGSSATGNEYRRCMEGMGWQRRRIDEVPPQDLPTPTPHK